ncbi:MAG TPA: hypothetical protein VEK38_02410, partial [Candidatus Bathyarchaeia archaeon]|nr:hypothetical protein [Candidatus Bathyarchaeia archaeon]
VYLAENKEMEITDSATINLLNSLQTIKNMQEGSMEVENSNAIDIYLENISAKTCRQVISYLAGELLTDVLDMTDLGLLINAFNYLNPADAIILDRLCAVYAKRVEKIDNLAIFPSEIVKKITSSILVPVVSYVHTCLGNELLGNFDNYLEKRLEVLKLYSSQKNIITMHGGNSQYLFYVILQSPEDLTTAVYICENVAKKMTILPIKGEVVHVSPDGTLITSSMRDAVIPWKIRFFVTDVLAKKCYDMGMHDNCLAGAFKKGQELRFFLAGKNSTSEKNIFLFKIDTDSNNHKILWQCKREQLTKIKTDLSHILFNHQGTIVALGVNLSNPARTTKMIFIDMEDETDIKSMGDANMKCIELVSSSYLIPVSMLSNQSDICVTSIGCAFLYTYIFSYSKQKRTQKKKIDSKSMILRTIPTFNCLDAA